MKTWKQFGILCISMIFFGCQPNDEMSKRFTDRYVQYIENAKNYTIAIAELMPEENYGYKPHPDAPRSFANQMQHIAGGLQFQHRWHREPPAGPGEPVVDLYTGDVSGNIPPASAHGDKLSDGPDPHASE